MASIATTVGKVNELVNAASILIATARMIRDAIKAANPTDPATGELPSDADLINTLVQNSGFLAEEASELKTWLHEQILKGNR